MNERLLKMIIFIAGVVCLYALLALCIPPMFNAVLKEKIIPEYFDNTKYGELYYYGHIDHFRERDLPLHSQEKLLLFKSAERYIPTRFTEPHKDSLIVDPRSCLQKIGSEIRDYIFMPKDCQLQLTILLDC